MAHEIRMQLATIFYVALFCFSPWHHVPLYSMCQYIQPAVVSQITVSVWFFTPTNISELSDFLICSCRALEYICGGNTSVCDYNVIHHNQRERASDSGDSWILPTPYPLMTGRLKTCKTTNFRKSHRKLKPTALKCSNMVPNRVVMPESVGTWGPIVTVGCMCMAEPRSYW